MRRLPEGDRAEKRLAAGTLGERALCAIAERLAAFHERVRGPAKLEDERVLEELRARIELCGSPSGGARSPALPKEARQAAEWQRAFLAREADRFLARARRDAIREGHGELALDHVFVDDAGRVQILAGLEIAPNFRDADVAADVALLAADLAAHHRTDLAERFVAEYARLANDFDLYPLLDFYTSLRASIRAKLDWIAQQLGRDPRLAHRYRERARRLLALAITAPRRPLLPPVVVAMGGQVASGKSTLALHIARRIGAPVVGSDPTRDFLLGARLNADLHEARWEESYEPGFAERVYDEVLRRAGEVLASNRPVVIDGCFRSSEQRLRARALAARFGHPFCFVEACVSREVQRARLAQRAARDDVPLDDWQALADDLRASWEPVSGLSREEHLALDTSLPLDQNAEAIEARLPTWPSQLLA